MLDPKEEQQFAELKKLARKLHVPIPEVFIELEVFDKDGKLIQRHHQRSHSWVRNAYNMLFSQLAGKGCTATGFGAGKISIKDYPAGTIYDTIGYGLTISGVQTPDGATYGYRAPAGATSRGILVGSGTNAESFEDFALQTPIAEGTGAGELSHILSEAHSVAYADTTLTNTLIRYLNNNSGGNVLVNEVALVTYGYFGASGAPMLMSRDKLASTVTIPDTGQLKVTYTVSLTYAA